jgi:hypothetical protein
VRDLCEGQLHCLIDVLYTRPIWNVEIPSTNAVGFLICALSQTLSSISLLMSLPVIQPFVPLPPVDLACDEAFIAAHDNLPSNGPPNGIMLTAVDIPDRGQLTVSTIELYGGLQLKPIRDTCCFVDALLIPQQLPLSFDALYHRRQISSDSESSSAAAGRLIPAVPEANVRLLGRIYLMRSCRLEHQHGFYQHNFTLDPRIHRVILVSHVRDYSDYRETASLSASVVVRGRMLQSSDLSQGSESQDSQGSQESPVLVSLDD